LIGQTFWRFGSSRIRGNHITGRRFPAISIPLLLNCGSFLPDANALHNNPADWAHTRRRQCRIDVLELLLIVEALDSAAVSTPAQFSKGAPCCAIRREILLTMR
jgi:hypothetical protein